MNSVTLIKIENVTTKRDSVTSNRTPTRERERKRHKILRKRR